jgi:hypothetical protein
MALHELLPSFDHCWAGRVRQPLDLAGVMDGHRVALVVIDAEAVGDALKVLLPLPFSFTAVIQVR